MSAPYMPLFVSDYLSHTAHLSAAEHGAYMLLIMNYWQREKPLPADPRKLARIARMSDAEWAEASESLSEFFQEVDGAWVHKRIEEEIAKAADKIEKAKANGKLGGRPPKTEPDGNPPVSGSEADAKLLDEMRLAEINKDAANSAASLARAADFDFEDAERRCGEAAGVSDLGSFEPIKELIERGADLDRHVLPTIRAKPASGGRVGSWKYYVARIAEAMLKDAPASKSQGPPKEFVATTDPSWLDRCRAAGHSPTLTTQDARKTEGWFFPTLPTPKTERDAA